MTLNLLETVPSLRRLIAVLPGETVAAVNETVTVAYAGGQGGLTGGGQGSTNGGGGQMACAYKTKISNKNYKNASFSLNFRR